jgi:hypothetical protein
MDLYLHFSMCLHAVLRDNFTRYLLFVNLCRVCSIKRILLFVCGTNGIEKRLSGVLVKLYVQLPENL